MRDPRPTGDARDITTLGLPSELAFGVLASVTMS